MVRRSAISLDQLIQRGVLTAGDKLEIKRRAAPAIHGVLQADGSIRVGSDVSDTPSKAARIALGVGTVDGWVRWRVPRLGYVSLAELRGRLDA